MDEGESTAGVRPSAHTGLMGHVIQTRETLFLRGNVAQFLTRHGIELTGRPPVAWLGVPMLVGGPPQGGIERVLGVLAVQHYSDPAAYDDMHRELLEAIAAQAAIAFENARLYQLTDVRLQHRVEELTALGTISRELNSTLERSRIFDLVLDGAMKATGARYASIHLLDPERQRLNRGTVRGYSETALPPESQALGQGVIGRAVVTGKPMVVDDVAYDRDYLAVTPEVRSELCVPISYAGSVVGAINLESPVRAAFNQEHVSFVAALASQAAIAIGNAQRME